VAKDAHYSKPFRPGQASGIANPPALAPSGRISGL